VTDFLLLFFRENELMKRSEAVALVGAFVLGRENSQRAMAVWLAGKADAETAHEAVRETHEAYERLIKAVMKGEAA